LASVFEEHEEDARATKAEPYTTLLVNGVLENREEIDDRLDEVSIDWTVERMPATDRNILRIAVYEMYFADELIDKRIAINEAVEIAKEYGTDESPAFVNGVLGKLARA
jgi:N utilization substance protein B